MTDEVGRDFRKIDLSAFGGVNDATPIADLLKPYEDAGLQRAVLTLGTEEGPFAFRSLRFFNPGEFEGILERLAERCRAWLQ